MGLLVEVFQVLGQDLAPRAWVGLSPAQLLLGLSSADHVRNDGLDRGLHHSVDGVSKGSAVYMPPSVRSGTAAGPVSSNFPPSEKASMLRGEDFPSLQAALPALMSLKRNIRMVRIINRSN